MSQNGRHALFEEKGLRHILLIYLKIPVIPDIITVKRGDKGNQAVAIVWARGLPMEKVQSWNTPNNNRN